MKALIVDDQKMTVFLLETWLKKTGYEVISAGHGVEALIRLKNEGADLIVSDILMPEMDGFQLCREVRADPAWKDIPFIFFTATYLDEKDEELAFKVGGDAFIRKPAEAETFIQQLQQVLNQVQEGRPRRPAAVPAEEAEILKLYNQRLIEKLDKKNLDLQKEISRQQLSEERLERKNAVLDAINKVFRECLDGRTAGEVALDCLKVAQELTGSKFGFINELNPKGLFDCLAITDPGWEACRFDRDEAMKLLRDRPVRGVRGKAVNEGRAIMVNDPASEPDFLPLPPEHPPITSFLGVPLVHTGQIIGLMALANKENGYNQDDLEDITALSVAFSEALVLKKEQLARRRAEIEMRQAREREQARAEDLAAVLEAVPVAVLIAHDPGCRRMTGNRLAYDILGLACGVNPSLTAPEDERPTNYKVLADGREVPPEDLPMQKAARLGIEVRDVELDLVFEDGSSKRILHQAAPLFDDEGRPRGAVGVYIDLSDRLRMERDLKAAVKEKDVLLREIHHRVKNNMQVVSSLLSLQAAGVGDERVIAALRESRNRIVAMAMIHDLLYRSRTLSEIDLDWYVRDLASALFQTCGGYERKISLEVETGGVVLSLDQTVPCGLVLNELLTNSLKYAFPSDRPGTITIRARYMEGGRIELLVADDGVGLPPDLDWRSGRSLGLLLVTTLVEQQMKGELDLDRTQGTRYTITLTKKTGR
ncbi:MAG: histidine kinase dimerization/phosphoacceptor domain -containing protein [Thermodesulfobacteriota bacterium]